MRAYLHQAHCFHLELVRRFGDGLFIFYLSSSSPWLWCFINSMKSMMQKWIFLSSANIFAVFVVLRIYDIYQMKPFHIFESRQSDVVLIISYVYYLNACFGFLFSLVFCFGQASSVATDFHQPLVCSLALPLELNFEAHIRPHWRQHFNTYYDGLC